jgi:hypothetical protein
MDRLGGTEAQPLASNHVMRAISVLGLGLGVDEVRRAMLKSVTIVCSSLLLLLAASVLLAQRVLNHLPCASRSFPGISDADPSIVHEVIARIPERLKVMRRANSLSVSLDLESFRDVRLLVGKEMVTGVECELRVYPKRRASESQRTGLASSSAP